MSERMVVSPEIDFKLYDQTLESVNSVFPQRQGLSEEEFAEAIIDPTVVKSNVRHEQGGSFEVPQLCKVETFSWLNGDFYAAAFPDAHEKDAIRHFTDIKGEVLSDNVSNEILAMAERGGVLVFDFPDVDADYPERVKSMLTNLGVESSLPVELGTQAYFAGKVRLKAGFRSGEAIKGLHQSFSEMIDKGIIAAEQHQQGASYAQTIDKNEARRLYPIYESAFRVLNQHPCRQGLNPDEFYAVMTEEEESAKLIYRVDGEVSTLLIFGDDLSKYPWINAPYYKSKFPEEYDGKQIMYFPALCTDPKKQGDANSEHVINLIAQMVEYGNNEIVVAFDCCDVNDGFLDKYIEFLVNKTPEANLYFERLGTQRYMAYELSSQ